GATITTTTAQDAPPSAPVPDLAKVRDLIIKNTPNAIPELITGSTVDELTASVDRAVEAYNRIAAQMQPTTPEQKPEPPAVPAGATVAVNLDDLPAPELIRRGLIELKRRNA